MQYQGFIGRPVGLRNDPDKYIYLYKFYYVFIYDNKIIKYIYMLHNSIFLYKGERK